MKKLHNEALEKKANRLKISLNYLCFMYLCLYPCLTFMLSVIHFYKTNYSPASHLFFYLALFKNIMDGVRSPKHFAPYS